MGKKDKSPPQRLAYRIDELVGLLGVSKRTIERRIADGTLRSTTALGARLVDAESIRALFSTDVNDPA